MVDMLQRLVLGSYPAEQPRQPDKNVAEKCYPHGSTPINRELEACYLGGGGLASDGRAP